MLAKSHLRLAHLHSVTLQTPAPINQTPRRHRQRNLRAQTRAIPARRHLRPWEKSDVCSRMPLRVRIEEMISPGIVLVHTLLHQAHPQHARVKIEILLRRPGNRRDVMESVDSFHRIENIADSANARLSRSGFRPSCRGISENASSSPASAPTAASLPRPVSLSRAVRPPSSRFPAPLHTPVSPPPSANDRTSPRCAVTAPPDARAARHARAHVSR